MIHLKIAAEELEQFCQRNHIRRLSLFGSMLTGAAGPNSDIDFAGGVRAWA